jgi:hypothetical protein
LSAALLVPLATSASAQQTPSVKVLSTDFVMPLQFAVTHHLIFVADSGTSTGSVLFPNGKKVQLVTGPQRGEVAGVDVDARSGTGAYTSTDFTTGATRLTIVRPGKKPVVADISGFESHHNPDANVHYGVKNPSACVTNALAPLGAPVDYTGVVDSHPYSVASLGNGNWVVADAAGNDLLKVDSKGHVSLLALLPPQPLKFTADLVAALGLPNCMLGVTYAFEPVPTDVEVGPGGKLYVSTLPGGPEGAEGAVFGKRGSVYTVNQHSGKATRLATGFAGATNVALDSHGNVYVAELFGGQISKISRGTVKPYVSLPNVAGVEYSDGVLYASTMAPTDEQDNPTGNGSIVKITS